MNQYYRITDFYFYFIENYYRHVNFQIQIVNTKLCVRDAEFNERADILRRENERLRRVRARIREVIAADESLRRALEAAADCDEDLDMHCHLHTNPQEGRLYTPNC